MDNDKILPPPPPREHDRSPNVANAEARAPRLPWIPPRFDSEYLDILGGGHQYYDYDDTDSPAGGRSNVIQTGAGVDQDNPHNS